MSEQHSIFADRVRRADPTRLISYRLVDFTFKIVQWIAFASFLQAVGLKSRSVSIDIVAIFLLTLVFLFVCRCLAQIFFTIYAPRQFSTKIGRKFAYVFSFIFFLLSFSWLFSTFTKVSGDLLNFHVTR